MGISNLVIYSQLIPPRYRRGVLHRARVEARLEKACDYPLTIVQAGTGYGKTTALAALGDKIAPFFWYTVAEPDRDPLVFLAHLLSAFEPFGASALQQLEECEGWPSTAILTPLLNALTKGLSAEAVLVLDDFHLVQEIPEIQTLIKHLIDFRPPRLHIVISTRQMPVFPEINRWRVKGQMAEIRRAELAFTAEEVESLFKEQYGYRLTTTQVQRLAKETEGWIIALQLVWQSLQSGASPSLEVVLARLPDALEQLFDYLAPEVLARQTPSTQEFLLTTSVLRQMDGPACDALLQADNSKERLKLQFEQGLFIDAIGEDVYRYQRLFHDFLLAELCKYSDRFRQTHLKAADYYRLTGRLEETIYHLLEAQEYRSAIEAIESIGADLIQAGRPESLVSWIARLPSEFYTDRPKFLLLLGDTLRLRADFDTALERYTAAEHICVQNGDRLGRSQALRGQAQVYLDTVRPLKADALLEQALRLLEPQEHRLETASLYAQLAENKLNLGYPQQAEALRREARLLRAESDPGDIYLEGRAFLRTGHLVEGRKLLEDWARQEQITDQTRPQRFHREIPLLLSLICVMQGDAAAAQHYAKEGIAIGQRLQSDFVEAVGYMRLGHALQLHTFHPWGKAQQDEAIQYYQQAIEQVRPFKVTRVWVEPLWGLCRVFGYSGDLVAAEKQATQALEISTAAGDEWISNLLRASLGAGFALNRQFEAAEKWLNEAVAGFDRVGDLFGRSAAQLWLAWSAWAAGDQPQALAYLEALLPTARAKRYDTLLIRCTHLGLRDDQAAMPLLLEARKQGLETEYLDGLLTQIGLADIEYHPGYTLYVQTLGPFKAWCGDNLLTGQAWRRGKARQLFRFLISRRGQWLSREQIVDQLWPDLPPEAAIRDFKVALNALNHALEPNRPQHTQPFFVVRRETMYGLNPAASICTDTDRFEQLAAAPEIDRLRQALALYEDDYLPECCYDDWSAAERDRLRQIYLTSAERLAHTLSRSEAWEEVIRVCQAILVRDKCWEPAYQLLMSAYDRLGNRALVLQIYQQCREWLEHELDIAPSASTTGIYRSILAKGVAAAGKLIPEA